MGVVGILLLMGILSGCGNKPTAESLLKETMEHLNKTKSVEGTYAAAMDLKIEETGVSATMALGMNGSFQFINSPSQMHLAGTFHMDQMGMEVPVEMYMDGGKDKISTYVKAAGQWIKSETEKTEEENSLLSVKELFMDTPELAEHSEKENGKEVYVLTGKVDGKNLDKLFKEQIEDQQLGGQNEAVKELYDSIDFSKADIPMTIKIDKNTKLPAVYEMDLSGLFNSLFDTIPEEETTRMSVEKCQITFVFENYDDMTKIEIPKEALDAPSAEEIGIDESGLGAALPPVSE